MGKGHFVILSDKIRKIL